MLNEFITTICSSCSRQFYIVNNDDACPYCNTSKRRQRRLKYIITAITVMFAILAVTL